MHSTVYQISESCRQDVTKYCNVVITWSATLQEVVMARFSPSRRHLQYSLISGLSRLSVGRMERGKNKAPSFHHSIYNFPWGLYGGEIKAHSLTRRHSILDACTRHFIQVFCFLSQLHTHQWHTF